MGGSRRRRRGGSSRDGDRGAGNHRAGAHGARERRPRRDHDNEPEQRRNGAAVRTNAEPIAELCEVSPFAVFCTLYLGITERDGFREQSPREVAQRFALSEEQLGEYLERHGLSRPALDGSGFDLESARLDIEVAPEGISRVELARSLFRELERSPRE